MRTSRKVRVLGTKNDCNYYYLFITINIIIIVVIIIVME